MIKTKLLLGVITSCLWLGLWGQTTPADSLESLLLKHTHIDTTRVNLLNKLAAASIGVDPEKAVTCALEANKLSDSLGFESGSLSSLFIIGSYHQITGDFAQAINNYKEAEGISIKNGNIKAQINSFRNIGYCYCMLGNTSDGIDYFKKVLLLYQEEGDEKGVANSYNNLGNVYQMTGDIELAIGYFNKAIEIWNKLGGHIEIADIQNNLGQLYMSQDQNYQALESYLTALVYYEKIDNKSRIALAQNGLGAVYFGLNELNKAKEYFLASLKTNQELNNKETEAYCYSNLANIANEEGNYELSVNYYNQAYQILSELGLKSYMGSVLNNLSKAFKKMGDYDKSIESSEKALEIFKIVNDRNGEGSVYVGLALTYFEMEDYKNAENYAIIGLEISKEYGQLQLQKAVLEILFKIYEIKGNYKASLINHKQLMLVSDSLFNEEKVRKVAGLEYKYIFDKEKHAILLEQQKNDAIKLEELRRHKLLLGVFIIAFIVVSFFIVVINKFYKQTKRANARLIEQNRIIQKQKEEKELLVKEIHHRVKNNLQIITSLFDLQMNTTQNKETRTALMDGLNRVKSVGLIHQLLYQTNDLVSVDFAEFTEKLVDHIASFASNKLTEKIIQIPGRTKFNIETTISLGLIINELLTNSFKYAFNENTKCKIEVVLVKISEDRYSLTIADNGGGLPENFDPEETTSLGLRLVYTLDQQLSGNIKYEFDNGAKFTLVFLPC